MHPLHRDASSRRVGSTHYRLNVTLTVEEVDRLAAACDRVSRRYGDYVRLAGLLGLRAGELTALQVGDVDLTTGVVTIRRTFSAGKLQTPKSRRVRQVPVVGELGPILARMINGREPSQPVLLGPLGGRLYHSNFRTKVRSWSACLAGRDSTSMICGLLRSCCGFGPRCR